MDRSFALEINMTKTCNFRCTYCYEQDISDELFTDDKPEYVFEELVAFIDDFRNSEYVKLKHDGKVRLTFWGGEPLMRFDLMKQIVEYYLADDTVSYFLYTNGYFKDEILQLCNLTRKFDFQISYDGDEIHNKNRVFPNGESTLGIVKENIKEIATKLGRKVSLKPTAPMGEDFRLLTSAYKDYLKMYYWFRDDMGFDVKNMHFKPTPSFAHKPSSPTENLIDKYIYEETLSEIAELDKIFYNGHGTHFFSWFNSQLSVCGAGKGLAILDRDYKVYSCHNFLYYDPNEVKGHILYDPERDQGDMNVLYKNLSMFSNCNACSNNKPTKKCQECDVKFCMRCNTAIFMSSDSPDFLTRWTDMGAQNTVCDLFKLNHEVYKKYFMK